MALRPLGGAVTLAFLRAWASTAASRAGSPLERDRVVEVMAPLPFVALSLLLDGPATVWAAVQHLSLKSMAAVAYIAWISTLLGFGLWTYLMSRYPVNRVAPFTLLVPVVGLTTGWVAFGEQLLPVHFAGAGLLMAGLVVNVFGGPLWSAVMSRLRAAR